MFITIRNRPLLAGLMHFLLITFFYGCKTLDQANYPKSRNTIELGVFQGPFTGRVEDSTGRPLSEVWVIVDYTITPRDDSTQSSKITHQIVLQTGRDGSYTIPYKKIPKTEKIDRVLFRAYKFGYVGYRSDAFFEGGQKRNDFSQKDNLIVLQPITANFSHKDHLAFLGCEASSCKGELSKITEQEQALMSSAGSSPNNQSSTSATVAQTEPPSSPVSSESFLDAKTLLLTSLSRALRIEHPEDKYQANDFPDTIYDVKKGPFYASVHLQSNENQGDRYDETKDVAIRIWRKQDDKDMDAMFDDLKMKSLQTKSPLRKSKEIDPKIERYDARLKVYGAIQLISRQGTIFQIACGNKVCKGKKVFSTLVDTVKEQLQHQLSD